MTERGAFNGRVEVLFDESEVRVRRRPVWLVTVVLLAGLATVTAPPARGADGDDWMVATLAAGPDGADSVLLKLDGTARAVGRGSSVVWGAGSSFRGSEYVRVDLMESAGRVVLATPVGRHEVELEPMMDGSRLSFMSGYWIDGSMSPGETLTVLLFLPGMMFEDLEVSSTASSGSVEVTTTRGAGSRVIGIAESGDRAAAVVAPWHAAGTTEHVAEVPAGVVGGAVRHTAGVGTWQGPDGNVHPLIDAEGHLLFRPQFAGPAGLWRWTWTGATSNDYPFLSGRSPILGAYAPVGDAWEAFAE